MTTNARIGLATAVAFVAGAIAVVSLQPGPADAVPTNKTITTLASTAFVHTICFRREAPTGGAIRGEAYGSALMNTADGGPGEHGRAEWQLGASQRTTVHNFMDTAAVTQWRTDFNLEQ